MNHRPALVTLAATLTSALAACGGGSPRPAAPAAVGNGAAAAPPPYYAALFEAGRTWTYDVESTSELYDPEAPEADPDGVLRDKTTSTATCRVAETRDLPGGKLSRIECEGFEGMSGADPITGVWAHDARGVWKLGEDLAAVDAADLDPKAMLLAAAPEESHRDISDEIGEEGAGAIDVTREGDAWCHSESFAMGDEAWRTVCIGPAGITRGNFGWAGGSTHDTTFTLRPPS